MSKVRSVFILALALLVLVSCVDSSFPELDDPHSAAVVYIGAQTNCTEAIAVTNQFNISGLNGWDLYSHEEYLDNSARHGSNLNCTWNIPKPRSDGQIILIMIAKLQLESSSSCEFDSLNLVFVDYNTSRTRNITYCGALQSTILLSRSGVKVKFRTDGSVNHRGFHLQWASVDQDLAASIQASIPSKGNSTYQCTNMEDVDQIEVAGIRAPGGRLQSHEADIFLYPPQLQSLFTYKSNMNCYWEINSPTGYTLIWIEYLQLESGRSIGSRPCPFDNLTISFSNVLTGGYVSQVFCTGLMDFMLLANSTVRLKFMSDSSVESRGFLIKWLFLNGTQIRSVLQTWRFLTNATSAECTKLEPRDNLTLSGVGVYPGGRLVSHSEFLTSRNSSYHPNMNCTWTITPPNNSSLVHLKILALDLETGSGNIFVCRYDNLTFTFRNAINDRWEQRVACNSMHSVKLTSSSEITIRFVTDHSVAKRGFHLEWYFVPRGDIVKLPQVEDMQAFVCPERSPGSTSGVLIVRKYQPNSHCIWMWNVEDGEKIEFHLSRLHLDSRDFQSTSSQLGSLDMACRRALDRLTIAYTDSDGAPVMRNFCGRMFATAFISAYSGTVQVTFVSDDSVQGAGFFLSYRLVPVERPTTDCAPLQTVNSHQDRLGDNLQPRVSRRCRWTVSPRDDKHLVKLTLKLFQSNELMPHSPYWPRYWQQERHVSPRWPTERRYTSMPSSYYPYRQSRYEYCSNSITWRTNYSVSDFDILRAASQVYSPQANFTSFRTSQATRRICFSAYTSYQNNGITLIANGPVQVEFASTARSPSLSYEILIDHLPVVLPKSADLCPQPKLVSTKSRVTAKMDQSRLISVKQMSVSGRDCRTSLRFENGSIFPSMYGMSYGMFQRGNKARVSVNCTESRGSLVLLIDSALSVIRCNTVATLNWTHQQNPIILESDSAGDFTATVEQIKWINDGSHNCPTYNPTKKGTWIATLPYIVSYTYGTYRYGQDMFYCEIQLSPPPKYDLVVQLLLPSIFDSSLEQLCSQQVRQNLPSQLSFILSSSDREDDNTVLKLCDQGNPGSLKLKEKFRVSSGTSMIVDLIAVRLYIAYANYTWSANNYTINSEIDVIVVVDKVEICQSLDNTQSAWKANSDRTQLLNSVTVAPHNTQADCKLQLDGAAVVRAAKQAGIRESSVGSDLCWELKVTIKKFATSCGINQLVLLTSYWDPMMASTVHRRIEVCDSSDFSYSVKFLSTTANESGVSLYYNEVRSGFVIEYALSGCRTSIFADMAERRGGASQLAASTRDGKSSGLTVAVLLLSLGIVCAGLFAFREQIHSRISAAVNRARGSQRLSYSTSGGEGVALVDDT